MKCEKLDKIDIIKNIPIELEKNECESIWKRNCPNCNVELFYKSPISYKHSIKHNNICKSCSFKNKKFYKCKIHSTYLKTDIQNGIFICSKCEKDSFIPEKRYIRKCPSCEKELIYNRSARYIECQKNKTLCKSCSKLGNKNPMKNCIGDSNPSRRDDVRRKLRLYRKKQIEDRYGHQISPNYNISACQIFQEIENLLGWDGQHAEKGGEKYLSSIGYWLDYYEPNLNIVIEFDEKHHKFQVEKDKKRQEEITNFLGCKFYRIKDTNDYRETLKEYINGKK